MKTKRQKTMMRRVTGIVLSTTMSASILGAMALPSQAATTNPINTNSRDAVSSAYTSRYLPATKGGINWTGAVSGCKPGTPSTDSLNKTNQTINFYRGLAGLDSVGNNATMNAKAQKAALMMEANGTLNHYPSTSWKCYTKDGATAASQSNLFGGAGYTIPSGAAIVEAYMNDSGASNTIAGHRRWMLNPSLKTVGIGTTKGFNAITVIGAPASSTPTNPDFIPFPNGGYFPQQLEPNGLWSLSSNKGVDFAAATVSVKQGGKALSVKKYPVANGYGPNSITFQVAGLKDATGTGESNYVVTVNNMKKAGKTISYSYTVKLFDGAIKGQPATTPKPTTPKPVVNNPSIKTSADIVTIDSKGVLWNYGTLNAKTATVKKQIGSGWGAFNDIHVSDWNGDGIQDLVGKTKAGQLYLYAGNKAGGFTKSTLGNSGWQNYTITVGKWKKAEAKPSILARDNRNGALYNYTNAANLGTRSQIGSGWGGLDINILDWDKDGKMDVVAKNSAGKLTLYRSNGAGAFVSESRKTIGTGWNMMNSVNTLTGHDGNGTVGVLARDTQGKLYYYPANKGTWGAKKTIGNGWNSFTIAEN